MGSLMSDADGAWMAGPCLYSADFCNGVDEFINLNHDNSEMYYE